MSHCNGYGGSQGPTAAQMARVMLAAASPVEAYVTQDKLKHLYTKDILLVPLIDNNFWTFPSVSTTFQLRLYVAKITPKFQRWISCAIIMSKYHSIISPLHILRVFLVLGWQKPRPATSNSWITSSTQASFWQRPGPFTTSMRLAALIFTLESVDQWFGQPRSDDNASNVKKYGQKIAHFDQKCGFTKTRNSWTGSNESTSLFLPDIEISFSSENCLFTSHSLLSWLCNRKICGHLH